MARVLVTVHGIRDNGDWQDAVSDLAVNKSVVDRSESYKYGFFVKFVFPPTRSAQVAVFRRRLEELLNVVDSNVSDQSIVHFAAHSFGTHVIYHALRTLPERYTGVIGNIVLMGSVLPSEADVVKIALGSKRSAIFNFCSVNDNVLLLNATLPLNSGLAGRVGFKGQFEGRYLQQRFFRFGHGGYFSDLELRERSWIGLYCLPALQGNRGGVSQGKNA